MTYNRVDLTQYVVISICFGCNNDCSICMLAGLKRKIPAIGFDSFKKVIIDIVNDGRFENLILSGAEVTTFDDLGQYVQFAASLGWFKKIQIQTNGRRLSDRGYLKHLIDCGVNEFFISIHGLDDVHEAITRMQGSFKETREGLKNIEAFDVNVISNTVLTKTNLHDMPPPLSFFSQTKQSEFPL